MHRPRNSCNKHVEINTKQYDGSNNHCESYESFDSSLEIFVAGYVLSLDYLSLEVCAYGVL